EGKREDGQISRILRDRLDSAAGLERSAAMESKMPFPDGPRRGPAARLALRLAHVCFAWTRGMTMGVRAACFDEVGRIFLVRHSYVLGWHLPGGGIERRETAGE